MPEEKKPTDYDMLAAHIADMEAQQAVKFNLWRAVSIASAKRELERWFNEEGAAIPVTPDPVPEGDNVSPPEVIGAEGWYTQQGIEVSVARSNGCVKIRKKMDTGAWYRDHAAEVAKKFGASERIICMMGFDLVEPEWYMLPTHDISGMAAEKFRVPYTPLLPEVPFNDAEKALFADNFKRFHFSKGALVGATFQCHTLANPDGSEIDGHAVWTSTNHPQEIIPKLAAMYASTGMLKRKYHQTLGLAHLIDAGQRARVPGYSKLPDPSRAYRKALEPTAVLNMPPLQYGP